MILTKLSDNSKQTEQQYRQLKDRLSYSSIKLYDTNRKKFFKEIVLNEGREDEATASTILGSLVHCLLGTPEAFDDKFHIASAAIPTGQILELTEALYNRAIKSLDSEGKQTVSFETLFTDAVNVVKYDYDMKEVAFKGKNLEKILELFTTPDKNGAVAELYYKEKMTCMNKQVIGVGAIQTAERIVEKLKSHPFTKDVACAVTTDGVEVFNELPILFEIEGVPCKSMPDRLIVNHHNQSIEMIDWKTSWNSEEPESVYTKMGYYIQAAMYDIACNAWKMEHNLQEYTVQPIKFIFCDTGGYSDPVVLKLTSKDLRNAKNGFKLRGWTYKGLFEIMADIQWSLEHGIWTTTRSIYENNGVHNLNLQYE